MYFFQFFSPGYIIRSLCYMLLIRISFPCEIIFLLFFFHLRVFFALKRYNFFQHTHVYKIKNKVQSAVSMTK